MSISTHVLDASTGLPAVGVAVRLESVGAAVGPVGEATELSARVTDSDGRIVDLHAGSQPAGHYRLCFDTGSYFGGETFYPEVIITFEVSDPAAHLHVPLLLSPYSYTTYRGS